MSYPRKVFTVVGAITLFIVLLLVVTACGITRVESAHDANEACAPHGGVAVGAQNQFYYHDDGEDSSWNATCADGTVEAGE